MVERHGKSPGNVAHGVLKDFGLTRGAVASSVGHDSHNVIVAGTNEADMRVALEAIGRAQGGVCVVADGKVEAMVHLPIAGLLSDKRVTEVAEDMKAVKRAWQAAGCKIPYMGFNLIPLAVIPEIRLTDKGLVLVSRCSSSRRWFGHHLCHSGAPKANPEPRNHHANLPTEVRDHGFRFDFAAPE